MAVIYKRWIKIAALVLLTAGAIGSAQAEVLHLGGRQFDPMASSDTERLIPKARTLVKRSVLTSVTQEKGREYYIVQFDGPVLPEWRKALENAGATVLDYVPDFAFIVCLAYDRKEAVSNLEHIRWIGEYAPEFRISPEAKALSKFSTAEDDAVMPDGQVRLRVDAFPGESQIRITEGITDLGGSLQEIFESEWGIRISATLPRENIDDVGQISGVKWVEIRKFHRTSANVAADIIRAGSLRTGRSGLLGEGQIVAVCDSGLDKGSATDIHADFLDGYRGTRVLDIYRWGEYDSSQDINGHGTHVAGLVMGNGQNSGANPGMDLYPDTCFAGMAPKALLVFQAVGDPNGYDNSLPGIPSDLKPVFQQALDASATIHTNSWGTSGSGDYTSECEDVDAFCWRNKDFLILFAAGNNGRDKDGDGVIDRYCIDTPATAKNCLSVGASESLRIIGGLAGDAWSRFSGRGYEVEPFVSDLTSDNAAGLAAFSSRGPCLDGRTKPDIVAPGTNILSARSSTQEGNGWGDFDGWYYYSGGTSMATPITAGAAAVLRGYLTGHVDQFITTPPSSAMLKACLVNAAKRMEPGQYGRGDFQEIGSPPGPAAGWGRLDLERAVNPKFPHFITYVDNAQGLETKQEARYSVTGVSHDAPLRITLAWTDYPATPAADGGLVNDLDLMVTDREGRMYYPDNARTQTAMSKKIYLDSVDTELHAQRIALRLTPDSYPKRLGSLGFAAHMVSGASGTVEVAVYKADENGYPGGEALFSKTLLHWAAGEFALPVDIDVTSGDVVAVFTFSNPEETGIRGQKGDDPNGRVLVDNGSGWETSGNIPAIGGIFFSTNLSETFDRVNNLVGVTIDDPSGDYTVTVKGYNVPQGPQPFALVISGKKAPLWGRDQYPFWRERR